MIMRMATKQPKILIPVQLILIVIALYGVRQLQHSKSVTDIDITTMAVSFTNNPLRPNQSKYCDWTKSKPNPPHRNLLLMALLLSGDVQRNPGPVKFPCLECKRPVAKTHYALQCDQCDQWVHYKCEGLTREQYLKLESDRLTTWFCNRCKLPNVITATSTLHLVDTSNFYQPLSDGYSQPQANDNQHTTRTTETTGMDGIRPIPGTPDGRNTN